MLASTLGLLATLVGAAAATSNAPGQEFDTVFSVDFYTDVLYNPPEAWNSEFNSACGTVDSFTTTVNASATIHFVGDHVQVSGMRNNRSGVMLVEIDEMPTQTISLWSSDVQCGTFLGQDLINGTHTMKLTLIGRNPTVGGGDFTPVLHLLSITYAVPSNGNEVPTESSTPAAGDISNPSSSKNVTGIVAGTICGVVGLAAVLFAIAFLIRRRARPSRRSRHSFNPNTVIITELSPRSPTDDKLPPYAQMDDGPMHDPDVKSSGHLAVPLPTLGYGNTTNLRSRSPSPAPPERRV